MKPLISLDYLQSIFPNGKCITKSKKDVIAHQHQKITQFYWLLEGSINYYIDLDERRKKLLVSKISKTFMPIGWGIFNQPHRFGIEIKVSSNQATFFAIPADEVLYFIRSSSNPFLIKQICSCLHHQIHLNLSMQGKKLEPQPIIQEESDYENYFISPKSSLDEMVELFRRSPFLGEFEETYLKLISSIAKRRDYEQGEEIIMQDELGEGLFILIQGEVALRRYEQDIQINMRSISTPGFIFGWSSVIEEPDLFKTITTTKTSVYFLNKEALLTSLSSNKEFCNDFYLRLIWLIGNQLKISFFRYINLRINHDVTAVKNLILNSKSKLKLGSSLHQVPHLLDHAITKNLAFEILHHSNKNGLPLERHISSISLDLLKHEEKELRFINGLQKIYEEVAEKNKDSSPQIVRKACAQATDKLFSNLDYIIDGYDNLPESTGHIFIYNHLLNPPYYTLVNNFQITLDSHFISSLILDKKYNEPGIRTVRIGKGEEYGHQNYYERLGYINVYTKDSDNVSPEEKVEARTIFYNQANDHLNQGMNLIISPEGTSYETEESPGPFKTGAFRLALQRQEKTLIIPIVICNFDKRVSANVFYSKILPPIDIKQHLIPEKENELRSFVDDLREKYKEEISMAQELIENKRKKESLI